MNKSKRSNRGFTLIASLLLLLLLSGMAIGLMMMVNTEGKVGGTDLQNNYAFRAAEGGMEQMYANLSSEMQNVQVPTAAEICAAGLPTTSGPSVPGISWMQYSVTPGNLPQSSCPATLSGLANWGTIASGPNEGLYAQVIPVNMLVTAAAVGGQEVTMQRQAQLALVPVFQFGMFCDADCSIFPGSPMTFAGPVHANGDFYPFTNSGSTLTFQGKIAAFGNVVRTQLPNTNPMAGDKTGTVYVPTSSSSSACSTTTTNCTSLAQVGTDYGDGSVTGGGSSTAQPSADINPSWATFSGTTTAHQVINGNYYTTGASTPAGTGATKLSLPFVNGTTFPYEILRRPPPASGYYPDGSGESATSALGSSREYNMAQIRVLLSDNPAEFQNGSGASDPENVRLANVTQTSTTATQYGVTLTSANLGSEISGASSYNLYFATASNGILGPCTNTGSSSTVCAPDWPYPPAPWTTTLATASGTSSPVPLLISTTGAPAAPYLTSGSIPTLTSGVITSGPSQPTYLYCPTSAAIGYTPVAGDMPTHCPASPASPYWYYWNGTSATLLSNQTAAQAEQTASWNLLDGWLRVEYLNNSGSWVAVTNEWLALGFARGVTPPTANGAGVPASGVSNPINPNAILILQQPADRMSSTAGTMPAAPTTTAAAKTQMTNWTTGSATCLTHSGSPATCSQWSATPAPSLVDGTSTYWEVGPSSSPTAQSVSQYNWYPINFYDTREGEARDVDTGDNSCTTNGVMNAVEIDVGNLQRWLKGSIGSSGTSVNSAAQNGYVLYFSDRRGMLLSEYTVSSHPAGSKTGDSGLEDTVNSSSTTGVPDGTLEPVMSGQTVSPEDDNGNTYLDNWGAYNLGLGFYGTESNGAYNLNTMITTGTPNPYGTLAAGTGGNRIASCGTTGRKNWVSGARHVLKLVDGALGNLPLNPNPTTFNGVTYNGGFTVASENPLYIQGDYNSSSADTTWNSPPTDSAGMAAAAVLADTVTLLSNGWDDRVSTLTTPTDETSRTATTTHYRVAIAAGKNRTFTYPTAWPEAAGEDDIGTDGGIHNFLHLLENWSGPSEYYKGSLASMYYSTYNTGFFKCCTAVYGVPTREFYFDLDFESPYGLPPGTPMFKDVESLGYRQVFTPRTQ